MLLSYNEYDDDKKNGCSVVGSLLWEKIGLMRGVEPAKEYRRIWKLKAGCSKIKGRGETMKVVSDGRHNITPREAAGVLMLALWDSEVAEKIGGGTGVSILPSQVGTLFDKWMAAGPSPKAVENLRWIDASGKLTYEALSTSVDDRAKKSINRPIPQSTLRSWVKASGGKFHSGSPCPPQVAMNVWHLFQAHLEKLETKNAN